MQDVQETYKNIRSLLHLLTQASAHLLQLPNPSTCKKKKKNMTRGKLYLLQFLPVVVTVSNYHGPELCGLEEFQDLPTTYFQEASGKSCVPLMDGEVEDVIYIGFNKFFPRALRESR